jgi:lipid-A-disaccharide synthase
VIAGEAFVPEFLQQDAQPRRLAEAVGSLLEGPDGALQRERLAKVRERLGDGGAARRTAAIAHEMLGPGAA